MVSPISGKTEIAALKFAANPGNQAYAITKAILNITSQLQRQASRILRPNLPTPCSSANIPFIALNITIRNRPEAAAPVLRLLCREFAVETHGLAQLYRALETGNLNHLPEASRLTADLDKTCAVNSIPNKDFVIDALDQLISRFVQPVRLKMEHGDNVNPLQLRKLVNSSVVLLKSLGKLSDNTVSTIGTLNTAHLEQLGALYNAALHTEQLGNDHTTISDLRNLLERKRNAILMVQESPMELENMEEISRSDRDVVLTAVQRMGWTLSFASQTLQNDREVVLAAVNQNGWALGFASPRMQNDPIVVMSAVQNTGIAFRYASRELQTNRDIALAAVRQNPTALSLMSLELQRDPEIRAVVFDQPQ